MLTAAATAAATAHSTLMFLMMIPFLSQLMLQMLLLYIHIYIVMSQMPMLLSCGGSFVYRRVCLSNINIDMLDEAVLHGALTVSRRLIPMISIASILKYVRIYCRSV